MGFLYSRRLISLIELGEIIHIFKTVLTLIPYFQVIVRDLHPWKKQLQLQEQSK